MAKAAVMLEESWQTFQAQIDAQLEATMQQLDADCPDRLRESMTYSLLAGGKRIRPVLVLLSCEACGGVMQSAMPAACAIEMIHTYSLIYDDLPAMDDDDLRRGRATNHIQFDEATAILAGDGLLTLAFEIVATEIHPPDVAAACCADLASAAGACGMVGGQMADLEAEHSGTEETQQIEAIHRRKTGRLLCSAVTLGARIAGADGKTFTNLKNYGKSVGFAFQIADDLLDLQGDSQRMGKAVGKDDEHGKRTYPALIGAEQSREKAEALIEQACRAIAPLGEQGRRLEALAHFVLERDH